MKEEINKLLERLKFHGMHERLDECLTAFERSGDPPLRLLRDLLQEEWRYRQERSIRPPDLWDSATTPL